MSNISIVFKKEYEYCLIKDVNDLRWVYKGESIDGDDLMNELENNKLINGDKIIIPPGTYNVSELNPEYWLLISNDFEFYLKPWLKN